MLPPTAALPSVDFPCRCLCGLSKEWRELQCYWILTCFSLPRSSHCSPQPHSCDGYDGWGGAGLAATWNTKWWCHVHCTQRWRGRCYWTQGYQLPCDQPALWHSCQLYGGGSDKQWYLPRKQLRIFLQQHRWVNSASKVAQLLQAIGKQAWPPTDIFLSRYWHTYMSETVCDDMGISLKWTRINVMWYSSQWQSPAICEMTEPCHMWIYVWYTS